MIEICDWEVPWSLWNWCRKSCKTRDLCFHCSPSAMLCYTAKARKASGLGRATADGTANWAADGAANGTTHWASPLAAHLAHLAANLPTHLAHRTRCWAQMTCKRCDSKVCGWSRSVVGKYCCCWNLGLPIDIKTWKRYEETSIVRLWQVMIHQDLSTILEDWLATYYHPNEC